MKRKNNHGFATIWLVIILSSLIMLLLVVTEAASGHAASSVGENICAVAGRSLLSEYNKQLFERYGIFALRAGDSRLGEAGSYYLESGTESSGGIVQLSLKESSVSGEEFPALSYELLMEQIRPLGTAMGIESIVTENSLGGLVSGLLEASEMADCLEDGQISELEELCESEEEEAEQTSEKNTGGGSAEAENESESNTTESESNTTSSAGETASGSGSGKKSSGKIKRLLKKYNKAVSPDLKGEEGFCLTSEQKAELPSTILGISPTLSLLLSGGALSLSTDAMVSGEYILQMCGSLQKNLKDTVLNGEIEYILYGHDSDKANERAVKLSLFEIRSAVNLAEIYADSAELAEINAEALGFSPVPQPVAAFALAGIKAAARAKEDVERLFAGEKVPFVKGGSGGSYEEYLRVLLALLPQEEKLVRLMDIMQMNLTEQENAAFAFQDFCYGVRIEASFEKKMRLFGLEHSGKRQGTISLTSKYQ